MKYIFQFIFAFVLFSDIAAAKSLYMTVRKDFSPNETPKVEVNYRADLPLQFRLLKPKDMKAFVSKQIDLRRAWKEPQVVENTSRYLIQGFNKSKVDLAWLRMGLNADLRRSQAEHLSGGRGKQQTKLGLGPKKFISTPEGFDVIQEFFSEPELVDKQKAYDVPGFNWWLGNYHSSFKTRNVTLPRLDPGFYVLQTIQGQLEGQVLIVVNNIRTLVHQTDGELVVRVTDRSGKAQKDAKVSLRNLKGQWINKSETNKKGIVKFQGVQDTELIVLVEKEGIAIVDTDFYSTTAIFEDLYLYTDRPMYKTGDKVRFRGILRNLENGLSEITGDDKVIVSLVDMDGYTAVEDIPASISKFGTFTGEFPIQLSHAGVYRVQARVENVGHSSDIRVKDYVKPLFYVAIESQQETLRPGAKLTAKVKIKRYAGGVPDATYRYAIYRTRMQQPQWVEDAGLGETGSVTTYGFDASENQSSEMILVDEGDSRKINDKGVGYLNIRLPKTLPGNPNFDYQFKLKVTAKDSDGNIASASKNFLDMKSENMAQARMTAAFAGKEFPTKLKVRSVYPSGKSYGVTKGKVDWYYEAYGKPKQKLSTDSFQTDKFGKYEVPIPLPGKGVLSADVRLKDNSGAIAKASAQVILVGRDISEGVIQVPEMTLQSRRDYFFAGETFKGVVLLPEAWGVNATNKGQLYITVVGDKIHETKVLTVNGLATWVEQKIKPEYGTGVYILVSYSNPISGWVERKFSISIPNKDKMLQVKMNFADENAMPGTEQQVDFQVLDFQNKPVLSELSVSVVDRAVLDLQPEFRPSLMNFFYPMTRLNLMSFVSGEFQSYGYGETVASLFKSNYWYAANKSEQDKLKEEDTAFWTGAVVTDKNGSASVKFSLPANQTIWRVTALAVDKSGRFGEGSSEFKSNLPISFILASPQFVRSKDQIVARVTVANSNTKNVEKINFSLTSDENIQMEDFKAVELSLAPKEEYKSNVKYVIADGFREGKASLSSQLEFFDKKLNFAHPVNVLDDAVAVPLTLPKEDGAWTLALSDDEEVKSATFTVTTGFMGALVPSMKWLVQYPYGCVEQVTSKTIPSLVLNEIFNETNIPTEYAAKVPWSGAGFFEKLWVGIKNFFGRIWFALTNIQLSSTVHYQLTQQLDKILGDVQTFSNAGLSKIAKYQNKNGSFSWFAGQGEGDLNMTLLVMMSLSALDSAKDIQQLDMAQAWRWLYNNRSAGDESAVFILRYIEARLHKLGIAYTAPSYIRYKVLDDARKSLKSNSVARALMALAIYTFEYKLEKDMKVVVDELITQLKSDLQQYFDGNSNAVNMRYASTGWRAWPGRQVSELSIVAHALHVFGELSGSEKRKSIEILLAHFNGAHFGSTFETSQAMLHMKWLMLEDVRKKKSGSVPSVYQNGDELDGVEVASSIGGWELQLNADQLSAGANLSLSGADDFLSTDLRLVKLMPSAKAQAQYEGWDIQRTYYKINPSTHESRLFDLNKDKLSVGDLLYVEIKYGKTAGSQSWWEPSHFVISDSIPAGLSVVEDAEEFESAVWYQSHPKTSVRRVNADKMDWYFRYERGWMAKVPRHGYLLRANYAGTYSTGVVRIMDFYNDESYAQSSAGRITVAPQ